uniref:Nuclear pore complex protein Nup153 n=1 Tax=Amphiprion ocellaris TaxID=80972 RepID=A0AAQ5YSB7_AMPOC
MTAIRRRNTDRHSDERAMAATGGGKIRSRRYHIASKPYAKSKQQQSGLISRVTDTVKSIVPSWLQKYFKNEDAPEGGEAVQGPNRNCQPPPPPNGSEEGPPPLDGRDSPEPSTSNTEPSTSRASLNFQEYVLSRPPLSRSHLHFTPLDPSAPTLGASSSLFSQPSTSSAPGPFSTGFSLVKEIKDNLSQHEDDNISTTSGFSSRASDKDVPTSKTASLPQLWSPETDRTNCGPQPSQSSLKKPAFNLSVFGTSSSSTLNSTVLNSSQLGDSPFYPGKTTYGGAAAVRSFRTRPGTPYQAPVRRQIKAKPAGAQPCGVTSATARRILQSLERMSSPLADAKRIPDQVTTSLVPNSCCVWMPNCFLMLYMIVYLQKLLYFSSSTMGSSGPAYPLSSTPAASSVGSGGGKMKRERSSARPSSKHQEDDEVAEVPDLPTISLPIGTSALPTFSFSSPLPPSFSPSAGFTFSAPVAKLGPSMSNGKLTTPIAATVKPATNKSTEDFEGPFKPAKTLKQGSVLDLLKAPGFASPVAQISPSSDAAPQQMSTQSTAPSSTSTTSSSLTGSTGFGSLFKASTDWSCDACLVPNKSSDTKCVCCAAPQPNLSKSMDSKPSPATSVGQESSSSTNTTSTTTTTTGFGTVFSKPAGTWDCDTCLVLNKPDAVKCVACETAKPGTGLKPSLTLPSAFSAVKTVSAPAAPVSTGFSGFGDKFKKPEGAWECDTCMVQNKAEDTKCVACTNPKPGNDSVTMEILMVIVLQIVGSWPLFKTLNPCFSQFLNFFILCVSSAFGSSGSSAGATSGSSTFGSSTSSSGGFKFGTSDSTLGSGGFKFGGSLSESSSSSSSGGFKFGVPFGSSSSETTSKDTTASSGFKFGSSSEGFKFGAVSSDDKKSDQPAAGSGFKFGVSGGIAFGTGSSSTESNSSKSGFTFGLSKPEEKTSDATTTSSSTVTFIPPSSQEKSDSVASSNDPTSTNTNSTTTTTTTTGSVFGRLGESTNSPQGASTFGSLQAGKEPAAPTFTFGKPEEKKEAAASSAPSAFLFGGASKDADAAPAPAATGGFSFGKPSAPAEQPPPAFTFGKPADKSKTSTSEAPKPSFTFGQSAAGISFQNVLLFL